MKTTPDPKPRARVKNRHAFVLFHDSNPGCVACTNGPGFPVEAHHVLSRAQGGDDRLDNLVGLCRSCHAAYHAGSRAPRRMIARFLRSDAGENHCAYLISKLDNEQTAGFSAEHFVQRLER